MKVRVRELCDLWKRNSFFSRICYPIILQPAIEKENSIKISSVALHKITREDYRKNFFNLFVPSFIFITLYSFILMFFVPFVRTFLSRLHFLRRTGPFNDFFDIYGLIVLMPIFFVFIGLWYLFTCNATTSLQIIDQKKTSLINFVSIPVFIKTLCYFLLLYATSGVIFSIPAYVLSVIFLSDFLGYSSVGTLISLSALSIGLAPYIAFRMLSKQYCSPFFIIEKEERMGFQLKDRNIIRSAVMFVFLTLVLLAYFQSAFISILGKSFSYHFSSINFWSGTFALNTILLSLFFPYATLYATWLYRIATAEKDSNSE